MEGTGLAARILNTTSHVNQYRAFVLALEKEVGLPSPHIVCIRREGGVATLLISIQSLSDSAGTDISVSHKGWRGNPPHARLKIIHLGLNASCNRFIETKNGVATTTLIVTKSRLDLRGRCRSYIRR